MSYKEKRDILNKSYEDARKRYNLPKAGDLQKDFLLYLYDLSPERATIVFVIKDAIASILVNVLREMEIILSGIGPFSFAFAGKRFTKTDRSKLFEVFKELQEIYWESRVAATQDEKESANWIKKVYKNWKVIKKKIDWYHEKMLTSWSKSSVSKTETRYVG